VSRSVLEKQQSRSASVNPPAEDDFAVVLECIEREAVSEDLTNLAKKLETALAQQKRRKSPN
jgi:hypothetical protein